MAVLGELKELRTLDVLGNACFSDSNRNDRYKMLRMWPAVTTRSFSLRQLNGTEVTVRERMKAARSDLSSDTAEQVRLDLTLQQKATLPPDQTFVLDLSHCDLQLFLQATQQYPALQVGTACW